MVNRAASTQRGVSLIEALVALLVLALGILGLAGIQAHTLVESRTTIARSIAIQMAGDLLDRMQANSAVRINPPSASPYLVTWGSPTAPAINCFKTVCDGSQLAAFDLVQWKSSLARSLPAGDAQVFQSTTDGSQFGVLIGWGETQAKNQKVATGAEATLYTDAIAIRNAVNAVGAGEAGISCPTGLICHLVYIRP